MDDDLGTDHGSSAPDLAPEPEPDGDMAADPDMTSMIAGDMPSHFSPDMAIVPPPTTFDETKCTVFVNAVSGSDGNTGRSKAGARKSISAVIGILKAGDKVCVYPGSYGAFKNTVSGTANARILFVSVQRWQAKVAASTRPVSNNGDYVDIDGFDVTTTASSAGVGIGNGDGALAEHCRIYNNHVHDIAAITPGGTGGAGILSAGWRSDKPYQGTDVEIFNNVVHDIGTFGSTNARFVQGIYISHPKAKIYNNIVYNVSGFGLHGWHNAADVSLTNNFTSNTEGIVLGSGDSPCQVITCTTANYFVTNNILYKDRFGVRLYAGPNHVNSNNGFYLTTSSGMNAKTADPQVKRYALDGTGDFHLKPGSPMIGAGVATYAPSIDHDGLPRPKGVVDIGPYEQ
jgi:hypothetical protein